MTPLATTLFVLGTTAGLIGFDIYLDRDGIPENTYSERIRKLGKVWKPSRLIIAVFFGTLLGHWYW